MTDWLRGLTTVAWNGRRSRPGSTTPEGDESQAPTDASTSVFRPPRRSDAPPEGNVTTLNNGERLDTPERFFDFLECYTRDHPDPTQPDLADRLGTSRRRAEQRRRRSYN